MRATTTHRGPGSRRRPGALTALVPLLLVVGVVPLLWIHRFYFRGDTQIAYTGWWYHLGQAVRSGHLPLMEPLHWEVGNYVAEGQWGLFSPLTILIGLLATITPNLVLFVTALKIGLIVLGGTGTYLLTRSFGAHDGFAVVAGATVGLCSQSVFLDWPSWVNGQIGVALLPWAWWFTRRAMAGRNPAGALALCYLVVSVGYVYCAIYLSVVLLACLVDAAMSRSRRALVTVLALGVFSGLVMLAVYLPGVLTAPVTVRSSLAVIWQGQFTKTPLDLFASMLPTPRGYYLLWLLPVVFWLDLRRLRGSWRDLAGAALATLVLTLWVLGPSQLGPLRWPARVLPALMVPLVVLLAVLASRCLVTTVSRSRLVLSLGWVAAAAWVVVAQDPDSLPQALRGAALVAAALMVMAWCLGRRSPRTTVGVVLLSTVGFLVLQFAVDPTPPSADRHMPAATARYAGRIPSASGDVMVLGDASTRVVKNRRIADELLIGASWYLNPEAVQNGYTTISFRAFRDTFCRTYNGGTCARALTALFEREPTTGRPWVDLLSVSTLVFFRPSFAKTDLLRPPAGWTVSEVTRYTVVWSRRDQIPTAGGVVAASAGSAVVAERVTEREVRMRVTSVGAEGGTVTLSRLAWPGYTVDGGQLGSALDGFLVRVDLPAGSAGSTVTLRWDPPGWTLEVWALATAVLGGCAWAVLARLRRRRPGTPAEADLLPDRSAGDDLLIR